MTPEQRQAVEEAHAAIFTATSYAEQLELLAKFMLAERGITPIITSKDSQAEAHIDDAAVAVDANEQKDSLLKALAIERGITPLW